MTDSAEDMGMMKKAIEVLEASSERHTESNERRKEENIQIRLQVELFQHTVEGISNSVDIVAGAMQEIKEDLKEIKQNQIGMDTRIGVLEKRLFNSGKFWYGVSVLSKNKWFWVFLMFCVFIYAVINHPEIRPFTTEIFGTMKAAKQ